MGEQLELIANRTRLGPTTLVVFLFFSLLFVLSSFFFGVFICFFALALFSYTFSSNLFLCFFVSLVCYFSVFHFRDYFTFFMLL